MVERRHHQGTSPADGCEDRRSEVRKEKGGNFQRHLFNVSCFRTASYRRDFMMSASNSHQIQLFLLITAGKAISYHFVKRAYIICVEKGICIPPVLTVAIFFLIEAI